MAGDRNDATCQAVHVGSRVLFCRYRVCQKYARQSGDHGWVAVHSVSDAGISTRHANAAWTIAQGLPWQPDRYFSTSTVMFFCLPPFPDVLKMSCLMCWGPSPAVAGSIKVCTLHNSNTSASLPHTSCNTAGAFPLWCPDCVEVFI